MDRHWLITWTTYGTWLPGDPRGFVGDTRDDQWNKILHNAPGTPYDEPIPPLYAYARNIMKGDPVYLIAEQAPVLLDQFRETATHRDWVLQATAIMANHIHLVVSVPGDPKPSFILQSFKAYGSRAIPSINDRRATRGGQSPVQSASCLAKTPCATALIMSRSKSSHC